MAVGKERQDDVAVSGGMPPPSAPLRDRVLWCLRKGLSSSQAATMLRVPSRTVRYHKLRLEKRGVWNVAAPPLPDGVPVPLRGKVRYRIHDFTISLPIHYSGDAYKRRLKSGNVARYRGHFLQFFPGSVVVRGEKDFGFSGLDADDALAQAFAYWEGVLSRMQERWGLVLLKRDCVFQLTYEIAEEGNDWAEEVMEKKDRVRVRDPDDGTTWLVVDASHGSGEVDTTHRLSAGEDMGRIIAPIYNDYRAHKGNLPLPSVAWATHLDLLEQQLRLVGEVRMLQDQVRGLAELQADATRRSVLEVQALSGVLKAVLAQPTKPEDTDSVGKKPDYFG